MIGNFERDYTSSKYLLLVSSRENLAVASGNIRKDFTLIWSGRVIFLILTTSSTAILCVPMYSYPDYTLERNLTFDIVIFGTEE